MYIFNLLNMFVLVVTTRASSSLNCDANVLIVAQSLHDANVLVVARLLHKCTRCRTLNHYTNVLMSLATLAARVSNIDPYMQ